VGYRQDVVANCTPRVGPAATRYLLLNIYSDWVLFLLALLMFAVVLVTRGLHTHAAALVSLVIATGVIAVRTRVKYVRAAAAFLGVERRDAKRIYLRTASYERWTRQHDWSSRSSSRRSEI
jgi:O-antigen ligase